MMTFVTPFKNPYKNAYTANEQKTSIYSNPKSNQIAMNGTTKHSAFSNPSNRSVVLLDFHSNFVPHCSPPNICLRILMRAFYRARAAAYCSTILYALLCPLARERHRPIIITLHMHIVALIYVNITTRTKQSNSTTSKQ